MSVKLKNGALRMWDANGRKTFDSDEQILYLMGGFQGEVVLNSVTNSSYDTQTWNRSYQLSNGDVPAGAELSFGMVRLTSGQWQRDWFTIGGTFVTFHKWMPVPSDGYRSFQSVIRQTVDVVIEEGELLFRESLTIMGRGGQGGMFGGGLISPQITIEYALKVGGFN